MKSALCSSLLVLATLAACRPEAANTTTTAAPVTLGAADSAAGKEVKGPAPAAAPASPAAARAQLAALRDSAAMAWQQMLASDDGKLAAMRRVLQELSQRPGAPRAALVDVRRAAGRLRAQRYDRRTMANPGRIDAYDAAQDAVLHRLYPLAAPGGQAPTAALGQQIEAIRSADDEVVSYRARYDRAAKAYNAYLTTPGATPSGPQAPLPLLPLFEVK